MIWNETKECMSRDEILNMQSARLRKTVRRVYHNVEFYRKKMQQLDLEPGDIKGIEDLNKLPFTTKQDLRDNYPFGLFAVPQSEVVRVHASSGTTGKATVVGYTRRDIEIWQESEQWIRFRLLMDTVSLQEDLDFTMVLRIWEQQ